MPKVWDIAMGRGFRAQAGGNLTKNTKRYLLPNQQSFLVMYAWPPWTHADAYAKHVEVWRTHKKESQQCLIIFLEHFSVPCINFNSITPKGVTCACHARKANSTHDFSQDNPRYRIPWRMQHSFSSHSSSELCQESHTCTTSQLGVKSLLKSSMH